MSHVHTVPLCPLYEPTRTPSSEYQRLGERSLAQLTNTSPSRLNLCAPRLIIMTADGPVPSGTTDDIHSTAACCTLHLTGCSLDLCQGTLVTLQQIGSHDAAPPEAAASDCDSKPCDNDTRMTSGYPVLTQTLRCTEQ